jgi:hypothetical protein
MSDDTYNGWTNRETWAVALHVNNDQGWQESVLDALRHSASVVGPDWQVAALLGTDEPNRAGLAGDIIRENVEESLDTDDPINRSADVLMAVRDIGSMWRVNWDELGAAFLAALDS